MKRLFYSITVLSMFGMLAIGFTGCTEDDDNPITPADEVEPPTNLKAYSDDQAVGLSWTRSESESQSNFGQYRIQVVEVGETDTADYVIGEGNGAIITDLTNGTRYSFRVFGEDTDGRLSDNYSTITWAPAIRQLLDAQSDPIRMYATTSATMPSGVDIYNPATGQAQVISQADAGFATRGDLYLYAENATTQSLEIRVAQNATNNPGPPAYFNSTFADSPVLADNLNDGAMTSPPNLDRYNRLAISVADGPATPAQGRMYFGRVERGAENFYFRMLVREINGQLVQGDGADRYVVLEFSYQHMPNVPYAKRAN